MSGDRALRGCMQALVLLNLAFAQMTGIASLHWLLPMYVLALASNWLARLRERRAYRLLWNGGILCFFAVLVRHALSADLAYVLEDGLVLAVLCQVHLLNNLRSDQRPDLLFFNAFLIAIITGFMNRGLGFPIAFALFIPCFVVGLQLLNATRDGRRPGPDAIGRLARDGVRRAAVVLACSFVVFLFWPRDFERRAYFHDKFEMSMGGPEKLELGFNEKLDLHRKGPVGQSDRKALRVTLLEGRPSDVPPLWRGGVLGTTEGGLWLPLETGVWRDAGLADERWRDRSGGLYRTRPDETRRVRVEVERFDQETPRIFTPLEAWSIRLSAVDADGLLHPRPDATVDANTTRDVRYEVDVAIPEIAARGGRWEGELPPELRPYVELPEDEADRIELARELATRLVLQLPEDAEQHRIVERMASYLSRTYDYLPPGSEGAPRSLEAFLRGDAGGHCEFFASALGTMLRTQDIPARLATGFRSSRWDAEGRQLDFSTRDAHVWVEVCDPRAGWYAVDPSPALADELAGASLWARIQAGGRAAWDVVTRFDSERRDAVLAWVRSVPGRVVRAFRERPLEATLIYVAALLPALALFLRRRPRVDPAIRAYRRSLRLARVTTRPGETPRQLLARARREGLDETRLQRLAAATDRHEAERYAV